MRRRSTPIYATMHGTSAKTWNSRKILLSGTWMLTMARDPRNSTRGQRLARP